MKRAMTEDREQIIRRLPEEAIARIAAGEMISRPASLVKELIENALDAGASRISVEVTEALDRFLRVSDDGRGIPGGELALALERHTTSKITREEDLLGVETLGFRGEALASIVAIAKVSVLSRTAGDEHACEVRAQAGKIGPVKAAARAPGTTVTVEDLFFNTPVRKRFLKKGPGEMRLARTCLSAYALSCPGVGWRLEVDGKRSLDLPPSSDVGSRLLQIHGKRLDGQLLKIDWREKDLSLHGFVGMPELARGGSQHQTFFVNGRWVIAPWIGQAVRHGFGDLLHSRQNPWVVLFIVLPPDRVDVNLHPTKREVRFLDERGVFGCVQRGVNQAVARMLPRLFLGRGSERVDAPPPAVADAPASSRDQATLSPLPGRTAAPAVPGKLSGAGDRRLSYGPGGFDGLQEAARLYGTPTGAEGTVGDAASTPEQMGVLAEEPSNGLVSLWQLHRRYVLAQTRKGLLMIDQHAAHERALYEQIRERMVRGESGAQQLLFPVVLELDEMQMELFRDTKATLARMGFDVEEFGENSVLVRGVPPLWRSRGEADLLRDLLDEAGSMGLREGETLEGLARSFACRAAIKAGEPLSVEEMNELVDALFATQRPHGDPHGRPTFIFISLQDLDRRFGRSGG